MWAVLWTDVFQVMVMVAAFLSVIIGGCLQLDGFSNMWRIADEGGRIIFWEYDNLHCKKNLVNFTVKYWHPFCQQNPVKLQCIVKINSIKVL